MKLFIILIALLISVPTYAKQVCLPATAQQIESVRSVLQSNINDAESARLIDVCVVKHDDGRLGAICGMINAKNKYAAYIGFTPFTALLDPPQLSIVEDTRNASTEKARYCMSCDSTIYCR